LVRDVTFAEDASQAAPALARRSWPARGNLVIGVLGRAGSGNLAAALRHHARDPTRPLSTLGTTYG
jgi:predicted RNA polymerase sigma factor